MKRIFSTIDWMDKNTPEYNQLYLEIISVGEFNIAKNI
jgi:hypothetical protein